MIQYTQEAQTTTVASQTSPTKGIQAQNYVIATEQPPGNPFLSCSHKCPTDIQESEQHTKTTPNGDTTIPHLTTTTTQIEEGFVRDERTNEFYLPLTSTVVLKREQEMLYVPLEFESNLTVDAPVDSRTYVSVFAQNSLETIEQNSPNNNLKSRLCSQFSNTASRWPARETARNNHA